MSKITALFEARNQISPELVKVQRELLRSRQALGGFDNETKRTTQTLGRMGNSMDRTARDFARDAVRMQREVREVRSEMSRLGSMREKPKVEIDDKATDQISGIKQQLLGLAGVTTAVAVGVNAGGAMSEVEAAFKERALYAAKGKTEEELRIFDQRTKDAIQKNPFLNRAEAMSIISKSEQLNGKNSGAYAEQASMLGVTTRFAPDEHLKMMAVLRENTGVDDAKRLANSLQYMSNNMKDFKDEFVDSIIEYSVQTSKFLDTPEKMAALVGEIGKMGIWSDDKAFDALKETTLKLTNAGDLTNVLKTGYEAQNMDSIKALDKATKEAAEITKLLTSGDKTDQQIAMGKMMLSMSTIQDKNMQQQLLNELGAGPGEDLGKYFAPLLEKAGKLATGEITPQIGNEAEKAYKAAIDANSLFEYQKAQNEAKQATLDFGSKIAQDVTPALAFLSEKATAVAEVFNGMSDNTRLGIEVAGVGSALLVGGYMLIRSATAHTRAAKALEMAALKLAGVGFSPDIDGPDKKNKGGGGDSKKRKWYNPMSWGGGKEDAPPKKNWLTTEEAKKMAFSGPSAAEAPQKSWIGKLGEGLKDVGGAVSKGAGPLLRKLPLIGTAIGAGAVLASDNKLETAAKVGTETLGGWGGAAAGAWAGGAAGALVGSIVPVVGTAIGGAVGASLGGIMGGIGGAFGGGMLFDKVQAWWQDAPATPTTSDLRSKPDKEKMDAIRQTIPAGPPVPNVSPAAKPDEKPKSVSLTIPQLSIPLYADGVLQDVPTMLRLLEDLSVKQKISSTIEKAFIDALETRGGVPV